VSGRCKPGERAAGRGGCSLGCELSGPPAPAGMERLLQAVPIAGEDGMAGVPKAGERSMAGAPAIMYCVLSRGIRWRCWVVVGVRREEEGYWHALLGCQWRTAERPTSAAENPHRVPRMVRVGG